MLDKVCRSWNYSSKEFIEKNTALFQYVYFSVNAYSTTCILVTWSSTCTSKWFLWYMYMEAFVCMSHSTSWHTCIYLYIVLVDTHTLVINIAWPLIKFVMYYISALIVASMQFWLQIYNTHYMDFLKIKIDKK